MIVTAWLVVMAQAAAAQATNDSTRSTASLTIQATSDSATVVVDSLHAGVTPLTVDSLAPGIHIVRIAGRNVSSWLEVPVLDTVRLEAGEHRTLRYALPARYALTSEPSGATVLIGSVPAGTTPMLLTVPQTGSTQAITLRKEGYEETTVDLGGIRGDAARVSLKRVWTAEPPSANGPMETALQRPGSLRLYITGIAAVLSGAVAAYYKTQADARNEEYLQTGNPATWSKVRTYDTVAGISLAAAQVSLGLFTYFLLSE